MHRLSYVIAAFTVIALVSPSLAEDAPKAGQTAKTERSLPAGGEARHEGGKIGGDRAGLQAETGKGGPGWHGARAEQVVIGDRRHHHHRHHYHAM
jgi:hypothetical protein